MKPFSFSVVVLALTGVLNFSSMRWAHADDTNSAPAATAGAGTGDTAAQADRREKMKAAFEQLDLTDAQKQQIQQIRQNTAAGNERRQQIMAVLTPEQKEKLAGMIKEHQAAQ